MRGKKWFLVLLCLALVLLASSIGVTRGSLVDLESSSGNAFQAWVSREWLQTTDVDFAAGTLTNTAVAGTGTPASVMLAARSGWWNTSWSRRAPVTINNPGSGLTNYQVRVAVNYDSDMKPDFSDIRFADASGSTELSYWRQSYTTATSAVFWVKVPSVPSGSSTVYMYYGNASASSASNGDATFEFFDDFSAGLSKWTIDAENTDKVYISTSAGNPSPSLRHDPDSSQTKNGYFDTRLITKDYKMLNGIIEYEVYLAGSARIIHQMGWRVKSLNFENGYCWRVQTATDDGGHLEFTGKASWSTFGTAFGPVSANTWHSVKEVVSGSTYTGYVDGGSAYSGTDSTKLTADYLVSHVHGVSLTASSYVLVDNIRVRQYAQPEPTTSTGAEEGKYLSSGTVASQVLDTGVAGARWDGLFWDEIILSGTDITFRVRASDGLSGGFPDSSWVSVGGTSPVILGLPSGRYMQWEASLTTSNTANSPTLQEVRVYHY